MQAPSSASADPPAATVHAPSSASADPPALPSRSRRVWLSLVALLLFYGNASVALQPAALRRMGFELPAPRWMQDAFLMSGMFTSYSLVNADLFLAGLRTNTGNSADRMRWVPLALAEHFPERQGVTFTQLFAMHHWDVYGVAAQRRAWKPLAAKIRARHNRLHPDRPIVRVRFGSVEWPQSRLGFRANKRPDKIEVRLWFEERP